MLKITKVSDFFTTMFNIYFYGYPYAQLAILGSDALPELGINDGHPHFSRQ